MRVTCPDAGCGRRIPLPPRHLLSLCANTSTRSRGRMFRYRARRSAGRTRVRSAHARLRLVGSLDDRPQRAPHVAPGASFLIKETLTVCHANQGRYRRTGPVAKRVGVKEAHQQLPSSSAQPRKAIRLSSLVTGIRWRSSWAPRVQRMMAPLEERRIRRFEGAARSAGRHKSRPGIRVRGYLWPTAAEEVHKRRPPPMTSRRAGLK